MAIWLNCAGSVMRPVVRTVNSRAPCLQVAAGQFQILRSQRVEDVGDGEVVGAQLVGIHQHVDFAPRAADDADLADALGVFELLLDQLVGDHREIAEGARRETAICMTGVASGSNFWMTGCLAVWGRSLADQVDLVLDFLGGDVAVLRKIERDDDERLAFGRSGAHFVDLADGVDGVFDLLGDFGFDFFGRSAGVGDEDLTWGCRSSGTDRRRGRNNEKMPTTTSERISIVAKTGRRTQS